MGRESASEEELVEWLLANAIPNGECLECHLAPSIDDRGRERHFIQVGGRTGTKQRVTRLIWRVRKGPIPFNRWVLHTCDNMKCISLDHLFLGTPGTNTQDMIAKGRHKYVLPNLQKASGEQVRQLRNEGLTYVQIGERLGLSAATAFNYCNGPYRDR